MSLNQAYAKRLVKHLVRYCRSSLVVALAVFSSIGWSNTTMESGALSARMRSIVLTHAVKFETWVSDQTLVNAILEHNQKNVSLDDIAKIDADWIEGKINDFVLSLQNNKVGKILQHKIESNSVIYVEAFLCDKQGAVVGEFPATSDYWQGDEDKFIKSFNNGLGQTYIGPLEFDESTQTHSVQISTPVFHDNETIGVLVVGLRNIK